MNNLTKEVHMTLDSREVSDMVGKRHSDLLRDIEIYIQYLENAKLRSQDLFIENSYKSDRNNKSYKCYDVTKKGCEFIAHKLTGQKGTIFTASYINKFHEMENVIQNQKKTITDLQKQQEIEARLNNSKCRQAKLLIQLANEIEIKEYKQILHSYASEVLTGQKLIPLPKCDKKTYSAKELGEQLGLSSIMVGKLANKHNLKTEQYGLTVWDKSPYSNKQVQAFRYYEDVIPVMKSLLAKSK